MTVPVSRIADARHDAGFEFRVVWQREGHAKKRRRYQRREAVDRLVKLLRGGMVAISDADPDDFACCSGYECGCHGVTNAQAWAEYEDRMPPLIFGPVVESRPVGIWSVERLDLGGETDA